MERLTNVSSDKENSKTGKLLREATDSPFSSARTPLSDVRNKLPQDNYVFNIRKTLYGTPASSKRKTPRSVGKCIQSKPGSRDTTPKRNVAMKPSSRRKSGFSDKKQKVVRFNLKDEVFGGSPIDVQDGGQAEEGCHDEEEKLDKEIEGFISSILKLTVEELQQESQKYPSVVIIPPTPSPGLVLHEDTPNTAEDIAKEFNIDFKETRIMTANNNTFSSPECTVNETTTPVDNEKNSSDELSSQVESNSNSPCAKDETELNSYPSKLKSVVTPTKTMCMKRKTVQCRSPRSPSSGLSTSIVSSPTSHNTARLDNIPEVVDIQSDIQSTEANTEPNTPASDNKQSAVDHESLSSDENSSKNVKTNLNREIVLDKTSSLDPQEIPNKITTHQQPLMVDSSMTTDPCTPQKTEQMVQVNPDVTSTACSPFQLAQTQETCDISMATDNPELVSQGTTAKPQCEDKMTWTDIATKKTSETSMTPVKTLSKNGKRLTAEEVRRQHPRAIANQLDTTLVCKTDLKHAEKERDKLKCIVKDLRMSLSAKHKLTEQLESQQETAKAELEEMHFSVVRDFQTKVAERDEQIAFLESEVNSLKSLVVESEMSYESFKSTLEERCEMLQCQLDQQEAQHLSQVTEMEASFKRNNYKQQFERSQQMILELQAQLDEFADIMADFEVTEKLQGEVHSTISETHKKLRYAGVRNAEMRKKLITEFVSMQKMKKELAHDLQSYKEENESLREECDSLAQSVSLSHDNNAQLESLYSSTAADLLQATSYVCQMNLELVGARKALQDLLLTKDLLVQHLGELKDKEETTQQDMDSLHTQLQHLHSLLQEETKRKEDWERIAIDGRSLFEEKRAEYEQVVVNLERTLDNREQDIDILEKDLLECREIILEHRHTMADMESEYKALKESANREQTDQTELQSLRDHVEFLEAERNMLIDCLRDSEEKIRSLFHHQAQNQKTICEQQQLLQESAINLRSTQEELVLTKEELLRTRKQTGDLVWKHDLETRRSSEALSALEEKMTTILGVLNKKVGSEADEEHTPAKVSSESLVSKVLKAVHNPPASTAASNTSQTNTSQNTDTSFSWSQSRPRSQDTSPLEKSKHPSPGHTTSHDASSLDSGYSNSNSFASPGEVSRSKLGYSEASAFAPVRSKVKEVPPTERCQEEDEAASVALVEEVEILSSLLSDIISKAHILEKASELSLQDLKGENCLLRNKVSQLEGEVSRLQQDRNMKTEELTEANQLIEDLKDRIREMGERIITLSDYQFDQRSIRGEVERLLGEVKRLEGEKEILLEQINTVGAGRHDLSHSGERSTRDVHMQRELIALKTKNQQMFLQMSEERDRYQDMGNKAARKMKILEDNWKKAEAEVFRFDELVYSIQKVLEDNKDFISHNPEILKLMRVINGEDTFNQPLSARTTPIF